MGRRHEHKGGVAEDLFHMTAGVRDFLKTPGAAAYARAVREGLWIASLLDNADQVARRLGKMLMIQELMDAADPAAAAKRQAIIEMEDKLDALTPGTFAYDQARRAIRPRGRPPGSKVLGKRVRGTCRTCGGDVSAKADGSARAHFAPRGGGPCMGSGTIVESPREAGELYLKPHVQCPECDEVVSQNADGTMRMHPRASINKCPRSGKRA